MWPVQGNPGGVAADFPLPLQQFERPVHVYRTGAERLRKHALRQRALKTALARQVHRFQPPVQLVEQVGQPFCGGQRAEPDKLVEQTLGLQGNSGRKSLRQARVARRIIRHRSENAGRRSEFCAGEREQRDGRRVSWRPDRQNRVARKHEIYDLLPTILAEPLAAHPSRHQEMAGLPARAHQRVRRIGRRILAAFPKQLPLVQRQVLKAREPANHRIVWGRHRAAQSVMMIEIHAYAYFPNIL